MVCWFEDELLNFVFCHCPWLSTEKILPDIVGLCWRFWSSSAHHHPWEFEGSLVCPLQSVGCASWCFFGKDLQTTWTPRCLPVVENHRKLVCFNHLKVVLPVIMWLAWKTLFLLLAWLISREWMEFSPELLSPCKIILTARSFEGNRWKRNLLKDEDHSGNQRHLFAGLLHWESSMSRSKSRLYPYSWVQKKVV